MSELITLTTAAPDDLDEAIRRVLTSLDRPEPDPVTALELATLRRDVRTYAQLHGSALADAVALRYALLDQEARAEAAELEAYQQGCAASNLSIELSVLRDEAQRRELHIVELQSRLESAGAELGQARARIAEVEEQLTRRLEEIDQLGRRLAEALDTRQQGDYATGREHGLAEGCQKALRERESPVAQLSARVVMSGGAPPEYKPCPHCGRDDFDGNQGRAAHVRMCPKNPDRKATPGRRPATGLTAPVAPAKKIGRPPRGTDPKPAAYIPEGAYLCPKCDGTAYVKSPRLDMCMKCAADLSKAA